MVTRPVTRKEMVSNPKAMEAFMKEWKGLWDQEVFDICQTREYDDVVNEAKKKGQKVHMARVHGLIYEKNYQLKEDDPARKFKGRGVLLGDQVKDQNMEAALFQDLGNSPATLDASRWADYYGEAVLHDKTPVRTVTCDMETLQQATGLSFELTIPEYLGGLMDLTGEVGRLAIRKASAGREAVGDVEKCLACVEGVFQGVQDLVYLPGGVGKKMGALRSTLLKIEGVLYELALLSHAGIRAAKAPEQAQQRDDAAEADDSAGREAPPREFAAAFLRHSRDSHGELECNFRVTHLPSGVFWLVRRPLSEWQHLEEFSGSKKHVGLSQTGPFAPAAEKTQKGTGSCCVRPAGSRGRLALYSVLVFLLHGRIRLPPPLPAADLQVMAKFFTTSFVDATEDINAPWFTESTRLLPVRSGGQMQKTTISKMRVVLRGDNVATGEATMRMGMNMPRTFLILLQGDSHVQTDSFRRKYVIRKGGWRHTGRFTVHDEKISQRGHCMLNVLTESGVYRCLNHFAGMPEAEESLLIHGTLMRKEGRKEGRQEGRKAGRQEGRKEGRKEERKAAHAPTRSQEPPTTAPKEAKQEKFKQARSPSDASTDISESDDDVIAKFQAVGLAFEERTGVGREQRATFPPVLDKKLKTVAKKGGWVFGNFHGLKFMVAIGSKISFIRGRSSGWMHWDQRSLDFCQGQQPVAVSIEEIDAC
ncbi:hypothetical protein AK812_SmicGene16906 [Symbiodinium microadriaticum]|uniref:Uncharacterized protein n=1 Tax=Symbiodinium microadriaticum TaxID=2951 RepID=A0A1Q9DZ46_SYMMI|nr:hypothetical protein AK812_SmicGene16906 [Symbiodinium microadriaticum]